MATLFQRASAIASMSLLSLSAIATQPVLAEQVTAASQARPSQARQGLPGRRISGGTRCSCPDKPTVIALAPSNHLSKTVSAQPSLYFLVSETNASYPLEFSLRDSEGNRIYETVLNTNENQNIVEIQLPQHILQTDEDYRWLFSIVYDADNPMQNDVLSGYLRQTENHDAKPVVASVDGQSTDAQTIEMQLEIAQQYQAVGLWNDAISEVASLHQQHPTNNTILAAWNRLLQDLELETAMTSLIAFK